MSDFRTDRCDSLSPESRLRCHLPAGHDGAHEARRGAYALSSWAHTPEERWATEKQAEAMRESLGWK